MRRLRGQVRVAKLIGALYAIWLALTILKLIIVGHL